MGAQAPSPNNTVSETSTLAKHICRMPRFPLTSDAQDGPMSDLRYGVERANHPVVDSCARPVTLSRRLSRRAGRTIAPAAQDYFQDVSPEAQTSEEWARQISSWQSAHLVVGRIEASIVLSSEASSASYTTAAVTNTATWFASTSGIPPTPRMRAAEDRIKVIQRRRPLLEDARASMRRLALDKPSGGQRAALEILDEASAALAKGIPSALVTLRNGIWAAISQLNQRKPAQETASGLDMVTSIGRQTRWTYLDCPESE